LDIKDEMSAGRNVAGDEGVGEGVNEGVGRNEARVFQDQGFYNKD
jgi:hypothetical protein